MPIDYKSYIFEVDNGSSVLPKQLFASSKPDKALSEWLVIVQYQYEPGNPPNPPTGTNGAIVTIFGTANGIPGIEQSILSSQKAVAIVGSRYLCVGRELLIGASNVGGNGNVLFVSAIENPSLIIDAENVLADSGVQATVPQFATSFTVAKAGTVEQWDADLNVLISSALTPGQNVPLHPLAYFVFDTTPQAQVYGFRKGYS